MHNHARAKRGYARMAAMKLSRRLAGVGQTSYIRDKAASTRKGAVANDVGIDWARAFSGGVKVSAQAARSIG